MIEERKEISKNKKNIKPKNNIKKTSESAKVKKVQPINKRKQVADEKSARIQKNRKIKKLISWTILFAIFAGIAVFLSTSEMFKICNIEITGNNQISQETLLLLSGIQQGQNVFLTNTAKVENKITQNPYIKEVHVKRMLPDKIKIEIIEKQKAYIIEFDGMYAYLDRNGYILEISTNKVDGLITLQGYLTTKENIVAGNVLCDKDLEKLEDLQNILNSAEKNEIQDKIDKINIIDKNNYILSMSIYKKIVYIGDTGNLATKMLRTKDIIDKTMELEGKIFVNGNFNDGFDPYFREEANN